MSRATERCSTSVAWVTELGRISLAVTTASGFGVSTVTVPPSFAVAGAPVSCGRSPWNRYGGV